MQNANAPLDVSSARRKLTQPRKPICLTGCTLSANTRQLLDGLGPINLWTSGAVAWGRSDLSEQESRGLVPLDAK